VKTLGIDLAAKPKKTAACMIDWRDGRAVVLSLQSGLEDRALYELIVEADKVGIDAPFGWPDEFVEAVAGHHGLGPWPGAGSADPNDFRASLSYRETDRRVMEVRRPLSVSTDKIGVTAMRCAGLLHLIDGVDRAGLGPVAEVYPAAALVRWGHQSGAYKAKLAKEALPPMVEAIRSGLPELEPADFDLAENDDVFDALICALVARAAVLGLTDPPPPELLERARREGWIHLPSVDSLGQLASAG